MAERVLIAGGGFAAVEAMLALRALAGDEAHLTLASPDPVLHYRPAATLEIAGANTGAAAPSVCAQGYDLHAIAADAGGAYLRDRIEAVDPGGRFVLTSAGTRLEYDSLVLATGARAVGGIPGALVFRDQRDTPMLKRVFDEVTDGAVRSIAFAVPTGHSWALPAYELALLCAAHAEREGVDADVYLVTPESAPLEVFGRRSSEHIGKVLHESGVRFLGRASPTAVRRDGTLDLAFAGGIETDRVVAVPTLRGRRIAGVPASWWGFVPVDRVGRVDGLNDVYAAGDMTAFPVKNGGLATQQADRIAHGLAESLGATVREMRETHILQAVLIGGGRPIFLRTELDWAGQPTTAALQHIDHPGTGWPTKVFGRYLIPYLEAVEPMAA